MNLETHDSLPNGINSDLIEFDEIDGVFSEFHNDIFKSVKQDNLKNIIADSVLKLSELRIKKNVPNKVMDEIGQCFMPIFKKMRAASSNTSKEESDDAFKVLENICQHSDEQDRYIQSLPSFVSPVEQKIGMFSFFYVPIKSLAERMLNDELVMSILNEGEESLRPKDDYISHELHTSDLQRRDRIIKKLRIEAYYDEYTIGSGKNVKKFMAGYLSNGNLDLSKRSRRADSNLFLLANCDSMKKNKLNTNDVFRPFVNDMMDLGSNGIRYRQRNGEFVTIYAVLSRFLGDNLGIYTALGLPASFYLGFKCRECNANWREIQDKTEFELLQYENINTNEIGLHEEQKINIPRRPASLDNIYGIKRSCIFLQIDGLHLGNFCPPDIFHDIAEGFLTHEILNVVVLGMLSNDIKIEDICHRIQSFGYYHGKAMVLSLTKKFDKSQKEHPMINLLGTGIQKLEIFFRLKQVFFAELDIDSEEFRLFCFARDFVILSFQDKFSSDDLKLIRSLSIQLINAFKNIKVKMDYSFNVTSKLHKILHYAENIKIFGPLRDSSTLQHERSHQIGKSWSRQMGCWKNPEKTIATRVARNEALFYANKAGEEFVIPTTSNVLRYCLEILS